MKKVYTKPELFCEEYELSVAIAGNCGDIWDKDMYTHSNITSCGYRMGFSTVFLYSGVCSMIPEVDGEDGTPCYQEPSENSLAFSS